MPKPRALTPAQEQAAYAAYQHELSQKPRGALNRVAFRYCVTHVGMRGILKRVEHERKDSRETFSSETSQ